jgi:hypothetical protein
MRFCRNGVLLEVLDVADGATLVEMRALWPALSVAELDRWLAAAIRRGAVERTRPGFEERWRLTRGGRASWTGSSFARCAADGRRLRCCFRLPAQLSHIGA